MSMTLGTTKLNIVPKSNYNPRNIDAKGLTFGPSSRGSESNLRKILLKGYNNVRRIMGTSERVPYLDSTAKSRERNLSVITSHTDKTISLHRNGT